MTHILLVYQKLIPSAVLCGHVQLEYLAGKKKIEYRHSEVYQVTAEMISWADTVILVRGALELDLLIAKTAKTAGKRTVYVLDDDLLNVPEHIESSRFYGSPVTQWLMKRIMGNCDCFASPSDVLLKKYGSYFKETAKIEEPAMNRAERSAETKETVNVI